MLVGGLRLTLAFRLFLFSFLIFLLDAKEVAAFIKMLENVKVKGRITLCKRQLNRVSFHCILIKASGTVVFPGILS